jgi:ABC-type sugar transport system ATPase subunit
MENAIRLVNIDKHFGIVHALKNVSLDVRKGEILALVGENGAGKSTLVKLLTGAYTMDTGEVYLNEKIVKINNTKTARKNGIGQVYHTAELVDDLSVAVNIFMGSNSLGKNGLVNYRYINEMAQNLLNDYDIPINARQIVGKLSVANKQFVAIAKVISQNCDIIIFDEPTAVLSFNEVSILFSVINRLKDENKTIIYISHRLEEIFQIANRIAVMRDGRLITILENNNLTSDDLIIHMLGKEIGTMFPPKGESKNKNVVLDVKGLCTEKISDVSFFLKRGEILGIAGLVGSGRTELARAVFGLDKITSGEIIVEGKKVSINSPKDALSQGIFLAPENRRDEGLVLSGSIRSNTTMSKMKKIFRYGLLEKKKEFNFVIGLMKQLKIKAPSSETLTRYLSGGNQQKVIVAKALFTEPEILIFDEPTQGIDVGIKSEIYFLLEQIKRDNKGIIFISSEMGELQGLCSRILVMRNGRLVGEIKDDLSNGEKILSLMYKS